VQALAETNGWVQEQFESRLKVSITLKTGEIESKNETCLKSVLLR
jgi:hypothetical protein